MLDPNAAKSLNSMAADTASPTAQGTAAMDPLSEVSVGLAHGSRL